MVYALELGSDLCWEIEWGRRLSSSRAAQPPPMD